MRHRPSGATAEGVLEPAVRGRGADDEIGAVHRSARCPISSRDRRSDRGHGRESGCNLSVQGEKGVIVAQNPKTGSKLQPGQVVQLLSKDESKETGSKPVPAVTGLPIRNAVNILNSQGIRVIVNGTGRVIRQQPPAGRMLRANEQVLLQCESSLDLRKLLMI